MASLVIGMCIMSLGSAETHGTPAQAAEGRELYKVIRDVCMPIMGREAMITDVTGAPIPESALWEGVNS